jgi:hypothetical protein
MMLANSRSLPKGLDDHFLAQIGGIIDQDVQMSASLTDSLKEGTYVLIDRQIAGNSEVKRGKKGSISAARFFV